MGCCGDEDEDDDIFKQLIPNPNQHDSTSSCSTRNSTSALQNLQNPSMGASTTLVGSSASASQDVEIISPMNSNFSALSCKDTLHTIFERLPITDLARAACVCRFWNSVASDREIQTRAFKSPWKLKDVIGNPSSGSFWCENSLGRFAISHHILKGDTVAGLAIKYSVQVDAIEKSIAKGTKVPEVQITTLIEILMKQAIKLDSIPTDGDASAQKNLQGKRVQKCVETLDALKISNARVKPVVVTTKWETFDPPTTTQWEFFD